MVTRSVVCSILTVVSFAACGQAKQSSDNVGSAVSATLPSADLVESCQYNPSSGKPNPTGMRTYLTIQRTGMMYGAILEMLPSSQKTSSGVPFSRGEMREVIFQAKDMNAAKEFLVNNPNAWKDLTGESNTNTYKEWLKVIKCDRSAPLIIPSETRVCSYDPTSGKPNPLGMRHFVTLEKRADKSVSIVNSQFPSIVGQGNYVYGYDVSVTFFNRSVAEVRELFAKTREVAVEVLGQDLAPDAASINAVLKCSN